MVKNTRIWVLRPPIARIAAEQKRYGQPSWVGSRARLTAVVRVDDTDATALVREAIGAGARVGETVVAAPALLVTLGKQYRAHVVTIQAGEHGVPIDEETATAVEAARAAGEE